MCGWVGVGGVARLVRGQSREERGGEEHTHTPPFFSSTLSHTITNTCTHTPLASPPPTHPATQINTNTHLQRHELPLGGDPSPHDEPPAQVQNLGQGQDHALRVVAVVFGVEEPLCWVGCGGFVCVRVGLKGVVCWIYPCVSGIEGRRWLS